MTLGSLASFGRALIAATPGVQSIDRRGDRPTTYRGVELLPDVVAVPASHDHYREALEEIA